MCMISINGVDESVSVVYVGVVRLLRVHLFPFFLLLHLSLFYFFFCAQSGVAFCYSDNIFVFLTSDGK